MAFIEMDFASGGSGGEGSKITLDLLNTPVEYSSTSTATRTIKSTDGYRYILFSFTPLEDFIETQTERNNPVLGIIDKILFDNISSTTVFTYIYMTGSTSPEARTINISKASSTSIKETRSNATARTLYIYGVK